MTEIFGTNTRLAKNKTRAISSGKPEGIMPEEKRLSIFFQGEVPKDFATWLIKKKSNNKQ